MPVQLPCVPGTRNLHWVTAKRRKKGRGKHVAQLPPPPHAGARALTRVRGWMDTVGRKAVISVSYANRAIKPKPNGCCSATGSDMRRISPTKKSPHFLLQGPIFQPPLSHDMAKYVVGKKTCKAAGSRAGFQLWNLENPSWKCHIRFVFIQTEYEPANQHLLRRKSRGLAVTEAKRYCNLENNGGVWKAYYWCYIGQSFLIKIK